MKQIVIHIGMHKTGSSSIQKTLQGYDDGRLRYADLGNENHSIPVYCIFSENRYQKRFFRQRGLNRKEIDARTENYRRRLMAEIAREREVILISGEDISRLPPEGVAAMKAMLAPHCDRVRIVGYARDPIGYASSQFQQLVKFAARSIEIPAPDYRERFEKFLDVFGDENVTIRRFDRQALHQGSVVRDLLLACGTENDAWPDKVTNESLSESATRLLFHFNRHGPISSGNSRVMAARREFVDLIGRKFAGPGFRFPPEAFHAGTLDLEDLAWLRDRCGIDFTGPVGEAPADDDALLRAVELVTPREIRRIKEMLARRSLGHHEDATAAELLTFLFYHELARNWKKR